MFRKRKIRVPIEIALKKAGVDMVGDIGKSLLKRLIEHGYSNCSIIAIEFNKSPYYENAWWDIRGVDLSIANGKLAAIYLDDNKKNCWHIYVWGEDDQGEGLNPCIVYSEYDLFGKLLKDV